MVTFHGRNFLLDFLLKKPLRFGIKMWAIAVANMFLFDCDIYYGKSLNIYSPNNEVKLLTCALSSRVVIQMN